MTFTTFLWFAVICWLLRKVWKWVNLKAAQKDYENAVLAGLRQDIEDGKIKWPRS